MNLSREAQWEWLAKDKLTPTLRFFKLEVLSNREKSMPMSMTGFGRGVVDAPFGRIVAEIQSINRKHLEIFVHLPREFTRFETEVRKWAAENIHRGQVTIRISFIPSKETILDLLPEVETLKSIKEGWEKISLLLHLDPKSVDLPFLVQYVPSSPKMELMKDADLPLLESCIGDALQALRKMKSVEGRSLVVDVRKRLESIKTSISQISQVSSDAVDRMREKLLDKMKSILPKDSELDERIIREVALYAEKVDIVEEITRLHSHFSQFEECLVAKGAVGRKMDFIVQEMGREINTIGSKSSEAKISYIVVEMKSELERIREQIQNIE